jgi:DNA-binding MarR family transcriptional regulator
VTDLETLAMEMNSVAIHLVRRVRVTDAQLGVPPARLSALSVLVFGGPRTLSELAAADQVTGPTITKVVQGLEASGLVRRRPHPDDGRATIVEATAKGIRLMHKGRALRIKQLTDQLETLSRREISELERGLRLLRRIEQQLGGNA